MKVPISFISSPSSCHYLGDRIAQLRYVITPDMRPHDYMMRLQEGWRRFGPIVFRAECPSCRMCQSLRVGVESFRPNQSQRRAWKRNAGEVTIRIGKPSSSPEKLKLFDTFHRHGHQSKGWLAQGEPDLDLFLANPFPTEEWTYYLGERLIGVGYVDALAEGLSAIYFFHDPADSRRSIGTFNILAMIESARERGLRHVYLGYYVDGCRSLEYKGQFRPNEILGEGGKWESFLWR